MAISLYCNLTGYSIILKDSMSEKYLRTPGSDNVKIRKKLYFKGQKSTDDNNKQNMK